MQLYEGIFNRCSQSPDAGLPDQPATGLCTGSTRNCVLRGRLGHSDLELSRKEPTTVDAYTRHPYYKQDMFAAPTSVAYQVMDQGFRDRFKDSFGQSLKITWWMMGGNIYRDATNLNVPVPNTMTLHLMKKYHGDRIQQLGDEVSMHYHTFIWSDYNGGTNSYWNQSPTFDDCRADFDVTLAQYLLEEGVFPVSFRSGWHFMDNDWQAYLNRLLPYCLHNDYGVKKVWAANSGPIAGVEDWSQATSLLYSIPPLDNQLPGGGRRQRLEHALDQDAEPDADDHEPDLRARARRDQPGPLPVEPFARELPHDDHQHRQSSSRWRLPTIRRFHSIIAPPSKRCSGGSALPTNRRPNSTCLRRCKGTP